MTTKQNTTDWERIEADYRAGILSVREIAASQGVSHTAIAKRAKKQDWERDLKPHIRAKSDALVSKAVAKRLESGKMVTERAIIQSNAELIADIRLNHRKDIRRARELCMVLLSELEDNVGTDRITDLKKLSETLKNLIALEREAYGIDLATKLELSGPNGQPLRAVDLDDEALAAIIAGVH